MSICRVIESIKIFFQCLGLFSFSVSYFESKANSPAAEPAASDAPLINALKQWRLNEARQRATPAYTILSNRVLTEIAISKPSSVDELLDISGVGQGTVEKFGPQILALVRGEEVA